MQTWSETEIFNGLNMIAFYAQLESWSVQYIDKYLQAKIVLIIIIQLEPSVKFYAPQSSN